MVDDMADDLLLASSCRRQRTSQNLVFKPRRSHDRNRSLLRSNRLGPPISVSFLIGVSVGHRPESLARRGGSRSDHLCLPQIKPEHIGDAVHPGSDGTECAPLPRRHVISARPCSTISECACHYSSPCRTAAHGADGVPRTPRYDRGTPCGSSRSTVLRMRFARVNAETSGGLECRS